MIFARTERGSLCADTANRSWVLARGGGTNRYALRIVSNERSSSAIDIWSSTFHPVLFIFRTARDVSHLLLKAYLG